VTVCSNARSAISHPEAWHLSLTMFAKKSRAWRHDLTEFSNSEGLSSFTFPQAFESFESFVRCTVSLVLSWQLGHPMGIGVLSMPGLRFASAADWMEGGN